MDDAGAEALLKALGHDASGTLAWPEPRLLALRETLAALSDEALFGAIRRLVRMHAALRKHAPEAAALGQLAGVIATAAAALERGARSAVDRELAELEAATRQRPRAEPGLQKPKGKSASLRPERKKRR